MVAAKLREHFPDFPATVVIYVRAQWDYIESGYNQILRFGLTDLSIAEFWKKRGTKLTDFRKIIETWQRLFGEDNVRCLPFDQAVKALGAPEHFAQRVLEMPPGAITGIEAGRPRKTGTTPTGVASVPHIANPKAGNRGISAVFYGRDLYRREIDDPEALLPAATVRKILQQVKLSGRDDPSGCFMDAKLGRAIYAHSLETNRWLAERFPEFDGPEFLQEPDWARLRTVPGLPELDTEEKAACRLLVRRAVKDRLRQGRVSFALAAGDQDPTA